MAPLRMTSQAAVDGEPVSSVEAAPEAGALLQAVRREQRPELEAFPPELQLEVVARKAALIATVVPSLARRVGSLVRRFGGRRRPPRCSRPPTGTSTRGNSSGSQEPGRPRPRRDVPRRAGVRPGGVRGRGDRRERRRRRQAAVLERLVEAYARPEALDWHLAAAILVRASHPFHRAEPAWVGRVEERVGAAEAALAERRRCVRARARSAPPGAGSAPASRTF